MSVITEHNLPPTVTTAANPRPRLRLDYLDGLRGLAALYVLLHHISIALIYWSGGADYPRVVRAGLKAFAYGHYAVDVFIVLSGFVLMLPVSRSDDKRLRGTFGDYLKRRARRILPPYFAVVALSGLVLWVSRAIGLQMDGRPLGGENDWSGHVFIAHLLLLQNVVPGGLSLINAPLWSVATEWQIYLLFPLLLLPVWRRWGNVAVILLGLGIGIAISILVHDPLSFAAPWYLGLFAMGIGAATVSSRPADATSPWFTRQFWYTCSLLLATVAVGMGLIFPSFLQNHRWVADPLVGAATATFLVWATTSIRDQKTPLVVRLLEARSAQRLGAFSYSLYLTHYPLLIVLYALLVRMVAQPTTRLVVSYGLFAPLLLLFAYLFSLAFERAALIKGSK